MESQFVVCIKNGGYEVSLEKRKIYRVIEDPKAAAVNMIRVIDETEEGYLFPLSYFTAIQIPKEAEAAS